MYDFIVRWWRYCATDIYYNGVETKGDGSRVEQFGLERPTRLNDWQGLNCESEFT